MIDGAPPVLFAERLAQHVQHCAATRISVVVEDRILVLKIAGDDGTTIALRPRPIISILIALHIAVEKIVAPVAMLVPHRLKVSGETLIEPDVRPIAAGDVIAEPLMRQLVRLQTIGVAVKLCARIVNHIVGLCGRGNVLHAAAEISRHSLCIFFVRIFQSRFFGEEFDHFGKTRSSYFACLQLVRIDVSDNRNARVISFDGGVVTNDD